MTARLKSRKCQGYKKSLKAFLAGSGKDLKIRFAYPWTLHAEILAPGLFAVLHQTLYGRDDFGRAFGHLRHDLLEILT